MAGRTFTRRRRLGLALAAAAVAPVNAVRADRVITTDATVATPLGSPGGANVMTVGGDAAPTFTLTGTAGRTNGIRVLIVGTDHGFVAPPGTEHRSDGQLVVQNGATFAYGNFGGDPIGLYGRSEPEQPYANTGYIGFNIGARGSVTVTGANSSFTNTNGTLHVGYFGAGTMRVLDGGRASTYATYIGGASAGMGASGVTVSGAGSTWANTSAIYGGNYSNASLTVADGATVTTRDAYFGMPYYTGTLGVSGANSTLNVTGTLGLGYVSPFVNGQLSRTGTLTIADGATVNANEIWAGISTANRINVNGGTLRVGSINSYIENVLNWTAGTVELTTDYGRIDGGVTVPAGGTLIGSGLLNSTTTVAPGGLVLPGESNRPLRSISLVSEGTIAFDLASLTEFRPVTADNAFTAGGTLRVSLVDGYVPAWGDVFDLMNFNRLVDNGYAFDFTNAALPAGLAWETSAFAATGNISVVPEPAMATVVAAGLFALTRRRRKTRCDASR